MRLLLLLEFGDTLRLVSSLLRRSTAAADHLRRALPR